MVFTTLVVTENDGMAAVHAVAMTYEHAMWKEAGLQSEPHAVRGAGSSRRGGHLARRRGCGARASQGEDAMDNLRAHPEWQ